MLADRFQGKRLNSPNDLVYRSDGALFFTDPPFGLPKFAEDRRKELAHSGVYSVINGEVRLLTSELAGPNGIALSPDETKLHVVGKGTWTLDEMGTPGQKGGPTPNGDGIAVDCAGTITANGTNSAYGGPDGKTLLIVGGGTNARTVQVTVPGLP